jgi:hypothetical protein
MVEYAIEYEAFVLVTFRTWREKATFDKSSCTVCFRRIKTQDTIIDNLNDMPEGGGGCYTGFSWTRKCAIAT